MFKTMRRFKQKLSEEKCIEILTNDQNYIDHELKYSGPSVQCFELIPDYISGKIIKES